MKAKYLLALLLTAWTVQGRMLLPNVTSGQVKEMRNLFLTSGEVAYINLEEYFRGSFMSYDAKVFSVNEDGSETQVYFPKDVHLASVSAPFVNLAHEGFSQSTQQHSLPQTTLTYTPASDSSRLFLIFIDFTMTLHIYDLSDYLAFEDFPKTRQQPYPAIPVAARIDLYSPEYIGGEGERGRVCTNLVILDNALDRLMMNCLAKDGVRSTQVVIDISDMTNVVAKYHTTQIPFETLRDGTYIVYQKLDKDNYIVLTKENRTVCYFDVLRINPSQDPKLLRRIAYFHQPPLTKEEAALYEVQVPEITTCEDEGPMDTKVDMNRTVVTFMQVQDIKVVPFHENVVVASDYYKGLLYLSLICTFDSCDYTPLAVIPDQSFSHIAILGSKGLLDDQVMFVMKVDPPHIQEIKYSMREKPSVRRIYTVKSDEGHYVSLSLMDANQDYVLAHMFSANQMKPVIRVYKRTNSFFSIGHVEFEYSDFIDTGTFFQFLNVHDNYFVVKTSDYFSVIKLLPQELILNSTDKHFKKYRLLNVPLRVKLDIQNMLAQQFSAQLDFMILSQERSGGSLHRRDANTTKALDFYYNCGERELTLNFDQYFSGDKNVRMRLDEEGAGGGKVVQGLLEVHQQQSKYVGTKKLEGKECSVKTVLENLGRKLVGCIQPGSSKIQFYPLDPEKEEQAGNTQTFEITSTSFIQVLKAQKYHELIILSNRSEDQPAAIVHFLRFYNLIAWEGRMDINKKYGQLQRPYKFRQYSAITFNSQVEMGVIISEVSELDNSVTILLFDSHQMTKDAEMRILGTYKLVLTPGVSLISAQIDNNGQIWVSFSNQTMSLYSFDLLRSLNKDQNPDNEFIAFIYHKKTFYLSIDISLGEELRSMKLFTSIKREDPDRDYSHKVGEGDYPSKEEIAASEVFTGNALDCCADLHILFFGTNRTVVNQAVRGDTGRLRTLGVLNLMFGSDDDDLDINVTYEYLVSDYTRDIVYHSHMSTYFLLVMKKYQNSHDRRTFLGYTLFIFDITQLAHGSLVMKVALDGQDIEYLDTRYVRLDVFSAANNPYQLDVYLILDPQRMQQYRIQLNNELRSIPEKLDSLISLCAPQDSVKLDYQLYPENSKSDKLHIRLNVINNGLAITQVRDSDEMIVSKDGVRGSASYSLLRVFRGQNISYDIKCSQEETTDISENIPCENYAQIQTRSRSHTRDIEFLNSQVKILGFFVLQPALLLFDKQYLHVYYPQAGDFRTLEIDKEFRGQVTPARYFLKQILGRGEKASITHLLFYQEDNNRFGVTTLFSKETYGQTGKLMQDSAFLNIDDQFFLRRPTNLIQVPWEIFQVEVYERPLPPKGVDYPEEYLSIRAILAIYDPKILYNSLIRFQDITFINSTEGPIYDMREYRLLSVNRLGLDTFIVNSMSLYSNSSILALGMQDYGLILYDILEYKIVKFLPMQGIVQGEKHFYVTSLIPKSGQSLMHAVINNNAVFSIRMMVTSDLDSMRAESVYTDRSVPKSLRREVAIGTQGYAFIQGARESADTFDQQKTPILKFFHFFANLNSKSLGEVSLDFNEDCRFLTTVPFEMAKSTFFKDLTDDSMVVAMICGSHLKLRTFDYRPDLTLNLTALPATSIKYQRQVYLHPHNSYARGNTSRAFTLHTVVNNQTQESSYLYYSLIAGISLALMIVVAMLRQGEGGDREKKDK